MKKALFWLLLCLAGCAQAATEITRELVAPDPLVPGQPAQVVVTWWTDGWFNPPPQWPSAMPIENGMLLTETEPNQLLSRRRGNTTWSGVRMSRQVVAFDGGNLVLPAISITQPSVQEGPTTATLPALTQPVHWPAGVEQPDRFLPASHLALQQHWQLYRATEDGELHVGDVVERQVTLRAQGIIPAQVPPLLFALAGTDTQRLAPQSRVLTQGRGDVTGIEYVERLRYQPQQAGSLTAPDVVLRWWDTATQRWQEARLPGKTWDFVPARAAGAETALRAGTPLPWGTLVIWLAVIMAGVFAAWRGRLLFRKLAVALHYRWQEFWGEVPLPDKIPSHRRIK